MNTTPILRATNIVKKLGGKTILNDVSLDVHKGDVKVVIGPSGAGKSTFLQCLNYLLPPDSGDIWLEGKKVNARDTRELCALRQQVGMIFQDFNLFDHLTAEENVSIALRKVMGCNKAEARNRALTELSRVGLAKRAALYPAQLSGGQKQLLTIARALLADRKLLILDEATAGLDPVVRDEILDEIAALHREKKMTIILVSHSMEDVARYADRIMVMNHGEKVFDAPPKEVFRHYRELEQIGLAAPQITYIVHSLRDHGVPVADDITTVEEAKEAILELLNSPDKARNGRKLSEQV